MSKKHPVIKICGIKNEEEIKLINSVPVSYMGFIFAKSKRQVTLEAASALRSKVREDIKVVGVFLDNERALIEEAGKAAHLDVIQLHGNETNEDVKYYKSKGYEVWKVLAIRDASTLERINDYPDADGMLLDTYHKGASGGTGRTFNWDLVDGLDLDKKLILAGGLTPDNAVEAYDKVNPDIMDLNSGLEEDLIKVPEKVNRLFSHLKEAYDE